MNLPPWGRLREKGGGHLQWQIVTNVYLAVLRLLSPLLAVWILLRCAIPLLTFRREAEIWGWLESPDGTRLPICHWENVLGRSRHCDIVLEFPTISRRHGVLTRYDDGSWTICDIAGKTGTQVNGETIQIEVLSPGDRLQLGGVPLRFMPADGAELPRHSACNGWRSAGNALLLTLLQGSICLGCLLQGAARDSSLLVWCGLAALQWGLLLFYRCIRRRCFEVETLACLLCTMGLTIIGSVSPAEAVKQLVAIALGMGLFLAVGWTLRDLQRAKKIRYLVAVLGAALLVITLLFGQEYYGAKNWLLLWGVSIQPSEITKICFVYVGASTLDRLMQKRNLILFIAYTVALCGLLACMNDFGTAMVFFSAFLMIAYLRSGSLGTVALALTALLFAAIIGLQIAPHALRRLQTWRHIWDDPYGAGYQQTQSLMCLASGGLLGLGMGNGKMRQLFASDSDMIFAALCEQWGVLMGLVMVLCVLVLAVFTLRCCRNGRSSFYMIASCTAASILLTQTVLNVLGTVDVLPLTGVTFPFVSNGGSSMVCVWALLTFIKAADTRKYGSFAVRSSVGRKVDA